MDGIFILLLALIIDLALGDPPTAWHPIGWIGKLISFLESISPRQGAKSQLLYGISIVLIVVTLISVPTYFLLSYLKGVNLVIYIVVSAVLLKSTFSVRGLNRAALEVKKQLDNNDLREAQVQMRALVSRDTEGLSEPLLVAATVESVAENTSDSFVAPLFWFLLLGVPGAIAYRTVNTFDSMIGYRGQYEYLGKFAAKLDDILNIIPARLTGLMITLAASISQKNASAAWHTMLSDHAKTESPNAGWPISAAAGALCVQLEKVGHYKVGEAKNTLTVQNIESALLLMWLVVLIWTALCFAAKGAINAFAS